MKIFLAAIFLMTVNLACGKKIGPAEANAIEEKCMTIQQKGELKPEQKRKLCGCITKKMIEKEKIAPGEIYSLSEPEFSAKAMSSVMSCSLSL